MRWRLWRRRPDPSEDARHALEHARRALADAERLNRAADDLTRRAEDVRGRWQETHETNHIAESVVDAIVRRVRHP